MRNQKLTIDEKVDRLHEQIESLGRRVADLEGRLAASSRDRSAAASTAPPGTIIPPSLPSRPEKPDTPAAGEPDSLSDVVIRWTSQASLFPAWPPSAS